MIHKNASVVAGSEGEERRSTPLPTDSEARKNIPMATGVLDYFPAALAAVAELSKIGNDKHNPGEELHWARGKSMDHADTIMRHLVERGTLDTDGLLHDAKVAWRALAMLQEELERRGAPMSRGSSLVAGDAPVGEGANHYCMAASREGYLCNRKRHHPKHHWAKIEGAILPYAQWGQDGRAYFDWRPENAL